MRASNDMSDWTLDRTISTAAGVVAGTDLPSDPTSDIPVGRRNALSGSGGIVQTGVVIRSGVGSYDCAVRIGGREIGCQISSGIMSPTYGYSLGFIPPEGSRVVVVLPSRSALRGIVVGFIPLGWMVTPGKKGKDGAPLLYSRASAGYSHYGAFTNPISDAKYSSKVSSPNNRPPDVLHGEVLLQNEHSCGFFGGVLSGNLLGSGAFFRASKIDGMARIRSANYERWSDGTTEADYNDLAYISEERQFFSYQGERLGDSGLVSSSPLSADNLPVIPHPRIKEFIGALASVETKIVERPDTARIAASGRDGVPKDEGVLSSHVGEAGEVLFRSAGGLSIERYDRIPSIRRIRKPYDPEGDRDVVRHPITPFLHDSDPGCRPLELFDAIAWRQKAVYQRFDEQEKDFRTQEEKDIGTPRNGNTDPSGSWSDMEASKGRRCGIYLEQNGGITIRDAWGSEISLVGGNIYISTPGSIISTANKSVVSMANDTNVMKSKGIAAVESLKYAEIRGASYVNVQGGYSGGDGGVLIESFGKDDATVSREGSGHGEGTRIRGITLKSGSGVNVKAANLRATVDESVVVGCGEDGARTGKVIVTCGEILAAVDESATVAAKSASVSVGYDKVSAYSEGGTSILSKGGVQLVRDGDMVISGITTKVEEASSNTDSLARRTTDVYEYLNPKSVLEPYSWDGFRKNVCSQLGTSEQYGATGRINQSIGKFRLYQPYWQVMKEAGSDLLSGSDPEEWPEEKYPVYGNYAWPGMKAWDDGELVTLKKSVNLDGGYSKRRDELSDEVKLDIVSFGDHLKV